MKIPARLSFVTLAVVDMARMQRFYDQFGWPKSKFSDETDPGRARGYASSRIERTR